MEFTFYDDGSLSGIYARACHLHLHFAMRVFFIKSSISRKACPFSRFCSVMMRLSRFLWNIFSFIKSDKVMESHYGNWNLFFFLRKLWRFMTHLYVLAVNLCRFYGSEENIFNDTWKSFKKRYLNFYFIYHLPHQYKSFLTVYFFH